MAEAMNLSSPPSVRAGLTVLANALSPFGSQLLSGIGRKAPRVIFYGLNDEVYGVVCERPDHKRKIGNG